MSYNTEKKEFGLYHRKYLSKQPKFHLKTKKHVTNIAYIQDDDLYVFGKEYDIFLTYILNFIYDKDIFNFQFLFLQLVLLQGEYLGAVSFSAGYFNEGDSFSKLV